MPKKGSGSASKKSTKKKATKKAATTAKKKSTAKKATKKAPPKVAKRKKAVAAEPRAVAKGTVGAQGEKSDAGDGGGKAATLRVKQTRSGIGRAATYRRTLVALGLKHYQDETLVKDNRSFRGMLYKVRHLVTVTREEK